MYDMLIIGSGPAGMSAAVYGKRAGLNLVVLEKNPVSGGQIIDTYEVDNYLGLPGINGFDLAQKFREHVDRLGAEVQDGEVISIEKRDGGYLVKTAETSYETKTIVYAAGATHARLGVPGEEKLAGRGVSYCATCDGAFFKNKTAVVVGGGDVAVEDAIFLARICKEVYLVGRRRFCRTSCFRSRM